MADEPFPEDQDTQMPTSIGDREWTIIISETDPPRAKYSVQILDQSDAMMDVKNGTLFEIGGTDHLRAEDKTALLSMDAYLKAKAEMAWIPE